MEASTQGDKPVKNWIKLLVASFLIAPALAGPLEQLPANKSEVKDLVTETIQKMDLEMPDQLFTEGQREAFTEFEISEDDKMEFASVILKSVMSGETDDLLPQAMSLVNPQQREKLALSDEQARFLFSIYQRLQK